MREGWRPSRTTVTQPRQASRAVKVLLISSVSFLLAQLGYIVTLAIAARIGVGVITMYTYSYMAMSLMLAIFVSSVPMVMAAPLWLTWDRQPASLLPHHEAVLRAGLLLVIPVLGAAALIGTDIAEIVLREFSDAQSALVVELFLVLSVNVIWGLMNTVPYAALVAVGRYSALALITLAVVVTQVVLSFVAGTLDSVWLLAAAVPASTALTVVAALVIVAPRYARLAGPRIAGIVVRMLLAGTLSFGVVYLIADALGLPAAEWLAFAVGLALYALLVTRPAAEREIAARLLAAVPLRGLGAATHR